MPTKYLRQLRELDQDAYDYVMKEIPHDKHRIDGRDLGLIDMCSWCDTPQGHEYWMKLDQALSEGKHIPLEAVSTLEDFIGWLGTEEDAISQILDEFEEDMYG